MEARGIEPLSENHLIQLSPSAADLLRFPSRIADRQAMRYGSHYAVTSGVAPCRSRSPLFDAPHPAAVLRGRTGGLIKPPRQRYCCRLLFKSAGFIAGPPPLLAYRISQSPSKPLRPHILDRPRRPHLVSVSRLFALSALKCSETHKVFPALLPG